MGCTSRDQQQVPSLEVLFLPRHPRGDRAINDRNQLISSVSILTVRMKVGGNSEDDRVTLSSFLKLLRGDFCPISTMTEDVGVLEPARRLAHFLHLCRKDLIGD